MKLIVENNGTKQFVHIIEDSSFTGIFIPTLQGLIFVIAHFVKICGANVSSKEVVYIDCHYVN